MKVKILIDAEYRLTPPTGKIYSSTDERNFTIYHKEANIINIDLKFQENDFLNLEFINKDDIDNNSMLIKKVELDGIDLQHFIYKGKFVPEYNKNWYEKQNPKPPSYYCPCTELRHKGTWSIRVVRPIWKMLMEEWLNDER